MKFIKSKAQHLLTGERGEKLACREIRRMGLTVLRKNYSVHGVGEIDIIARDGSCLLFVEVKTRRNGEGTRPGEAVDNDKKKKLWKTAQRYMRELGNRNLRFRFDVVEVYLLGIFRNKVVYLPGAFDMDSFK